MKNTSYKKPQSIARIKELLLQWQNEGHQELGVWAAECIESKAFVGWFMLKQRAKDAAELGYMLYKPQRGKGLATEMASALLDYAAGTIGLKKVIALVAIENSASIRILEKIGMSEVEDESNAERGLCYQIEF